MRRVTRAIVLAAGRGTRLGTLTDELPKALLPLGGTTLVGRQLRQMAARGVETVTLVVGYHADAVRATLGAAADGAALRYVTNPEFAGTGSGYSLALAADALAAGEPLLLTHGDIAYADAILDRCLAHEEDSVTAADAGWERLTDDEVLAWSEDGLARGIVKGRPRGPYDAVGEYIGVSVFAPEFARAFADFCAARVAEDPALDYEQPLLSDFLDASGLPCRVSYTAGVPWINVNYPDDLAYAREQFGAG